MSHMPAKRDADGKPKAAKMSSSDRLWDMTGEGLSNRVKAAIHKDFEGLRNKLRATARSIEDHVRKQVGTITTDIDIKIHHILQEIEAAKDTVKIRLANLHQDINNLRESLTQKPSLLRDMAEKCPTLEGWEQQAYKYRLLLIISLILMILKMSPGLFMRLSSKSTSLIIQMRASVLIDMLKGRQ